MLRVEPETDARGVTGRRLLGAADVDHDRAEAELGAVFDRP